jgi:hypothetical protein
MGAASSSSIPSAGLVSSGLPVMIVPSGWIAVTVSPARYACLMMVASDGLRWRRLITFGLTSSSRM